MGTSSAVMSIVQVVQAQAAAADMRCSTVHLDRPHRHGGGQAGVGHRLGRTGMSTGSGQVTRRNTMPVLGCAGRSVISTRCRCAGPRPRRGSGDLRVCCCSMGRLFY